MRKTDVPGFSLRTSAVYECLARDFIQPQLAAVHGQKFVISLIEMGDEATIIFFLPTYK